MYKSALALFLLTLGANLWAIDKDATYRVPGLTAAAEIIVDQWGVPHIYAQDHYDVFYVQGFNAARDRLWQIDLWRKRGLGELAERCGQLADPRQRRVYADRRYSCRR